MSLKLSVPLQLPLVISLCCALVSSHEVVRLFIAYCPTAFTSAGAVVHVDAESGNWSIAAHVKLPTSEVFGCAADYDPSFDFPQSDANTLWLDFLSDDGAFLAIDMQLGNATRVESSNAFFTGFIDFKYFETDGALHGVSGTVTESGYCSDGCLGYGVQQVSDDHRGYTQLSTLPFKAGADDTSFIDWNSGELFFQGSYDLRPVTCGPEASSECLVRVNTTDGRLVSATYTPRFQVFRFGRALTQSSRRSLQQGSRSALAFSLGDYCADDASSRERQVHAAPWTYQFLRVDLDSANATVVSCVDKSFVLDEDQWVAGFNSKETLLTTASGNGNGDDPQLVVLNVSSGAVVLNTPLAGLAAALHAYSGLVFVWAAQFASLKQS